VVVSLNHRDTDFGRTFTQFVVGLDHSRVADALPGLDTLHVHARRHKDVPVSSSLDHRGLHIVDGLLAPIVHLEDHFAQFAYADDIVSIGIQKPRIADLNGRRIGEPLRQLLHALLHRHHRHGLLAFGRIGVVAAAKVVESVIAAVGSVKATVVSVFGSPGVVLLLLSGTLTLSLVTPILFHISLTLLILGVAYGTTDDRSTGHADNGAYIVSSRAITDTAYRTAKDRTERGTCVCARPGIGSTTADSQQDSEGYYKILFHTQKFYYLHAKLIEKMEISRLFSLKKYRDFPNSSTF